MLGSGAIIVVDDSQPLVPLALRLAEFYRHESCGKCVPCREGTNWTVKMLERIDDGEATPMDLEIMAAGPGATSSATASACSATRWRCRSGRCSSTSGAEFEEHMEAARGAATARRSRAASWPPVEAAASRS